MQEEHLLEKIIDIAKDCGGILLSASDIERKIHQKAGRGNFVTDYDSRVQAILKSRLLELVPGAAWGCSCSLTGALSTVSTLAWA